MAGGLKCHHPNVEPPSAPLQGDITLNGHKKQDDVWRRVSAYVEQVWLQAGC